MRHAQASPDKSSRALFTAYGTALEEQGKQPSDDVVLHRFLFRMQKQKREGEALMQRFSRVLREEFGIDVEIDEDGEGIEVTTNLDVPRNGAQASLGRYSSLGRHSRRGSFESFFDGTADKVAGTEHGDLPVRKSRGSRGDALYVHGNRRGQRRSRSDTEAHSHQQAQLPIRDRINSRAHQRVTSKQHPPNHKRSVSVSSLGSLQIRRWGPPEPIQAGDSDPNSDSTDRTTSLDLSHIQIPGVNAPIPDDTQPDSLDRFQQYILEPFRPSDTRLFDEAETFEEQRLHRVTRDCIQAWRHKTQEQLSIRDDMENLASAFDRRILLKLSFEQLLNTARTKYSNRETSRFFSRLESRADKARNIFLLTKAFTHWAKSAEDEVQRTSVARRHILRTRFFNGWRDITAVNELKTQHFVLGKFLQQWRTRAATVRENAEFAVLLYEENLVKRVYKEWFFKFCAIAAPAWRNDRVRRVALQKMVEIAKVLRERESWAIERHDRTALRRAFQSWQQKVAIVRSQQPQADDLRRTSLLSSAFHTIQKEAHLAPLLRQFQARFNSRAVRTAFQAWRKDTQLSRQARNVDHMRIMRNAYTAWNDRLRITALEDRINDRVIVECLYKWTLASRVSLFQRVHNRQLKESTFLSWVTKTNQRANTLDAAERRFTQFKRAQLLRTSLRKMEVITAEKRREECAVLAEYQQKLKQRIFDTLKEKHEHFQKLNQWSRDAHFYIVSKHTLKTWGEASQHARRNRRRETYAQVRRMLKMNLVRRAFETWRDQANHLAIMNQQATEVSENRVHQSTGALLHQWHDRAITLQQQDSQATNIYQYKLETRYFYSWSSRIESLHSLDSQAVALRQESTELAGTSALKKLGWRLWNIQRKEETARALYERNFEKHARAMIRFWLEQTVERLAIRPVSPTPTSRSRVERQDRDGDGRCDNDNDKVPDDEGRSDAEGDEPQQLEPWTAFDETGLGLEDRIDLSLSVTPERRSIDPYALPPPSSTQPPTQPPSSILRRPQTYPQPMSALRPPPQTVFEDDQLDLDFGVESTFWTGTPFPPPPTTSSKPGYLKTPSKRSVVRAKRPELPASPEKRVASPVKRSGLDAERAVLDRQRGLGTMSAPPVQTGRNAELAGGGRGVTSFERRLREGGFGRSVAGTSRTSLVRGRGRGGILKGRVGFGNVSQMG